MTLTNILAAVGQFPQDDAILGRVLEISSIHGARLNIVHVIDFPGQNPNISDLDTLQGQTAFAVHDKIKAALTRLGGDPLGVEIRIEAGSHAHNKRMPENLQNNREPFHSSCIQYL